MVSGGRLRQRQHRKLCNHRLTNLVSHAWCKPPAQFEIDIVHPRQLCYVSLTTDLLEVEAASTCVEKNGGRGKERWDPET
jgi:hypothetical protein